MPKEYQLIEHMADVGLKAFGKTKKTLFQNAARGMFSIITGSSELARQKNQQYWAIKCDGFDVENLLVEWLSELLFIHNTDFVILNDFIIEKVTNNSLQAKSYGIKIIDYPYNIEMEIKAITYHKLQVIKNKKGYWEATVIFDI